MDTRPVKLKLSFVVLKMRVREIQNDNLLMRDSQVGVEMILGNYIDRFSNEVMRNMM